MDCVDRIRILLVNENSIVRLGLQTFLQDYPQFHIVGDVSTSYEALEAAIHSRPHIILMDFWWPNGTGLKSCRTILQACPLTKVLFLSTYVDNESIIDAMLAGASGYLSKTIDPKYLAQAIELIHAGQFFIDSQIFRRIHAWELGREKKWPVKCSSL